MIFGTHYYVLSLSAESTVLYEAFRDDLIRVDDQGFPVVPSLQASTAPGQDAARSLMRTVDECFDRFHSREPLGLVVVGHEELQSAFDAVTTHGPSVVGRVKGNRSGVGATDLGPIVWPVVKEVISAVRDQALRDLGESVRDGRIASGLDAVAGVALEGIRGTLLVEDEYQVRGSLTIVPQGSSVSADVDVRDGSDDAVDAVIDRVLAHGGNVVFLREGDLADHGRIALLPREASRS